MTASERPVPDSGRGLRSLKILRTVARYRLDTLIAPYAPDRLRWLFRLSPLNLIPRWANAPGASG